eukprot:4331837-Pyramimonas_sp.AAC.1
MIPSAVFVGCLGALLVPSCAAFWRFLGSLSWRLGPSQGNVGGSVGRLGLIEAGGDCAPKSVERRIKVSECHP